ncbi:histidinol-phosphate transaminase [Flavobacteriaceae bacterium UJ101]|nr:histidinol-phosphate transaminase [Flavobacteriaceae bacterium UJ101]
MNFNIENITRESVKRLKPYSSARDEFKDFNQNMIFLDANENPFNNGVNRYPDPHQIELKKEIENLKKISMENILLGNGSDEILDLIFRAFCESKKDNIIITPPTYGMYKVLAEINDVDCREAILNQDFSLNEQHIIDKTDVQTKVLFLCSPNNPTANSFDKRIIEIIIKNFKGLVVIDEAYGDFSNQESWSSRLEEFPNLIVCQTLSKAYGMAGIRLGMCFASKEIITVLKKIKPPYNVNQLTQQKALELLKDQKGYQKQLRLIIQERERLKNELGKITFVNKIHSSDTNFILIEVDDATQRYNQLIEKGIVIRNRTTQVHCQNCLRITVGMPEENNQLLEALIELKVKRE